ncbi:hypothetical protein ACKVMT_12135 [Halobacteriales archaeon Cl-PHB]
MDDGDTSYRDRRDVEVSVEPDTEQPAGRAGRFRSRLRHGAASVFAPRIFLLALVLSFVGLLIGGPLLPLGGLVGVALAGFGVGLLTAGTRYVELALAGVVAGGLGAFLDHLVLTIVGVGMPLVAAGALTGGVAALVGHYFGNDLRRGLTRDVSP